MRPGPRAARRAFGVVFVVAGVLHFVYPGAYVEIIPSALPWPLAIVYLSGAAEVAGGLGLFARRTQRAAGTFLILLLLLVWPANIQMLADARAADEPLGWQLLLWLRLPLQPLLAAGLWYVTRDRDVERVTTPGPHLDPETSG